MPRVPSRNPPRCRLRIPSSCFPNPSFLLDRASLAYFSPMSTLRPPSPASSVDDRQREREREAQIRRHRTTAARGSYDLTRLRCEGGGHAGLTLLGVRSAVLTKIDKEIGRFFCGADATPKAPLGDRCGDRDQFHVSMFAVSIFSVAVCGRLFQFGMAILFPMNRHGSGQ